VSDEKLSVKARDPQEESQEQKAKQTAHIDEGLSETQGSEKASKGSDGVTQESAEIADAVSTDEPTAEEGVSVAQLMESLEEANRKAELHWNELLRARADLENFRRRAARDVEAAHKYALERFMTEFLPVRDSMELGLNAAEQASDVDSLREGIELTLKMFNAALDKCGVKEVNPVGEQFDPELHQAMTVQESNEVEPGTVITVVQKGYLLNDRLIRPAMVVVAKENRASQG
jgi:molecular chaperone GrpE